MLVHDLTDEKTTSDTARVRSATPTSGPAEDAPAPSRPPRRSRLWGWALVAGTGALGIVVVAAIAQSDGDTTSVSDRSYEVAEANRMETLRDLRSEPVADGAYDIVETNRMNTLRDLATRPTSDDSFDTAEANRMNTLRDLSSEPVTESSYDTAETNRMKTLRDLTTEQ